MEVLLRQKKTELLRRLQLEILPLQGLKSVAGKTPLSIGLEPMSAAFPSGCFPTGAVHEFCTGGQESAAASCGFISGLMSGLMQEKGAAVWISHRRTLFPPALQTFGVRAEHIVFIDLPSEKKVLWAMEEALKCSSLSVVVAELTELSFTDSRRLQLATEQSAVTGMLLRHPGRRLSTNACISRWRITALPGEIHNELPGVGFPKWNVELLKIRNGKPGCWTIGWSGTGFHFCTPRFADLPKIAERKAG